MTASRFTSACVAPLLALALLPFAAVPAAAAVHVDRLGRGDGLPSNQLHAVVQGRRRGSIWFAGPSGLARYDGARIELLNPSHGLSTQGLRALAVDDEGRLWVGTDVGVDVFDGGEIRPLTGDGGWAHGFVESLAAAPDGTMWIGTARGLLSWNRRTGLTPATDRRLAGTLIAAVVAAPDGVVWAAGASCGLLRRDAGGWRDLEGRGWEEVAPVRTVAPGARGSVFVGGDGGLVEIDRDGRVVGRLDDPAGAGAGAGAVTAVLEVGDELWLGVAGQLRLYRRRSERWAFVEIVLADAPVNALTADVLGNVWVATDNSGAAKISVLRHALVQLDRPCRSQVYSIAAAGDSLLVGGHRCSWRLGADDLAPVERFPDLDRLTVWDLVEDRRSTLWAATASGLYARPPGRGFARFDSPPGLGTAPGRALLVRGDALWVGTVGGLAVIEGGRGRWVTTAEGEALGYVYTLSEDPDGRLWIGTIGGGLWREGATGGLERVETPEITREGSVYAVVFDGDGRTAVLQDDRLILLDGDRSRRLPTAVGDAVAGWSARFDPDGHLWVGGADGLVVYDPLAGRAVRRVTRTMGLAGDEFTASRSLYRAADGRLFCGTDGGLTVVDVAALDLMSTPPTVRLSSVHWSNTEVRGSAAGTVVAHGPWSLEVAVAVPWFIDERSVTVRHRLDGFDAEWTPLRPAAGELIRYTALPAGSYHLAVQAYSPLVGWGPVADLLAFRVAPPWWLRSWALALAAALAAAALALVWRWRHRMLLARAQELERRVAERTAKLAEMTGRLERLALQDPSTELPNRRAFWQQAARLRAQAVRGQTPFALLVVDLDNLKRINDRWGHLVGDDLLAHAAAQLRAETREGDLLARYGGDEFVALLDHSDERGAAAVAERMRARLAGHPWVTDGGVEIAITASFGVGAWQGADDSVEELFRRADEALYRAKEARNAVARWTEEAEGARPQLPTARSDAGTGGP